jgi:hypothetical protein
VTTGAPQGGIVALAAAIGLCSAGHAAAADELPNPRPAGCFVGVARDWNRDQPDDVVAFASYADRFAQCADQDRDELQVRSDLVGWYKSELGMVVSFLDHGQAAMAKHHYEQCYSVFDRMASLSQQFGDGALARWVTKNSERLSHLEDAFGAQPETLSGDQ